MDVGLISFLQLLFEVVKCLIFLILRPYFQIFVNAPFIKYIFDRFLFSGLITLILKEKHHQLKLINFCIFLFIRFIYATIIILLQGEGKRKDFRDRLNHGKMFNV